jgi:hypothetical protein
MAASRSTATRPTFGAISLSNSSHFPPIEYSKLVKPVTLPPGVKSRNEFQANGAINPCYNAVLIRNDQKQLLERLGKTEAEITAILWDGVDEIAARWKAIPAWVTVAMRPERGTYSAHFGLVSRIRHRRSIPMNLADRKDYVQLAPVGTKDARVTADLLNRAA